MCDISPGYAFVALQEVHGNEHSLRGFFSGQSSIHIIYSFTHSCGLGGVAFIIAKSMCPRRCDIDLVAGIHGKGDWLSLFFEGIGIDIIRVHSYDHSCRDIDILARFAQ